MRRSVVRWYLQLPATFLIKPWQRRRLRMRESWGAVFEVRKVRRVRFRKPEMLNSPRRSTSKSRRSSGAKRLKPRQLRSASRTGADSFSRALAPGVRSSRVERNLG